jgi:polyvinyl alcohol dehydrogenase (cytochrome)
VPNAFIRPLSLAGDRTVSFVAGLVLAACALAGMPALAAAAEPAWTTYHRDAQRSGNDPDGVNPIAPVLAWQSPVLGGPIWGQPLILGARVYVATVSDDLYALEASTGKVAWHVSAGTPVPSSALPCGDITPTVGIVGTPVIDAAAGVIYAVADTWNGSQAAHLLEGFRISNGEKVLSTPVDPTGADPKAILQRTSLNLDSGSVIFGYGGNDGDCSNYKGAVVSAPESGAAAQYWQVPIAAPSTSGGAVWATGGPAVDSAGDIYASTGNPDPPSGQEATTYDYSDSVVQLNSSMGLVGHFEPPNWLQDSNTDRDTSSGAPELLPGGLLFQAGKDGTGALISEASMASGAAAIYSHQVCGGQGSFGGDSYANGVIYIPCTNGVQALAYDASAGTFTPLWQGPSDAFGPPIVSAGLVWVVATGGFSGGGLKLYGLDPGTGAARYTEQLPSPVIDHFASPSAAGGRVLVATGTTVSAYQVALLSTWGTGSEVTPAAVTPAAPALATSTGLEFLAALINSRLSAGARGHVRLLLSCPAHLSCRGHVTIRATLTRLTGQGAHRHRQVVRVMLISSAFGPHQGRFVLTLHLGGKARSLLARHHRRLHVTVAIVSPASTARTVARELVG